MTEPVTVDINTSGEALLFAGAETDKIAVLAFHGGGGVDGEPAMLTPFIKQLVTGGGLAVVVPRYRTLNRDAASFEDMRADAANALTWATAHLPDDAKLFLLGASFGGLLALDALLEASPDVQDRVAGVILLNAVTNIGTQAGWHNRVVPADTFASLSPFARLKGHPLLSKLRCYIAHGGKDEVVPIAASKRFSRLWPEGRVTVNLFPNADHGFFNRNAHAATVSRAIRQFLELPVEPAREQVKVAATSPSKPAQAAQKNLLPPNATLAYGIGAQKAGTSWLYEQLAKSAQCHTGATKELHYFDAMYVKSESTHLQTRLEQLNRAVKTITPGMDPENKKRLATIELLTERLSIHATTPDSHGPYADYLKKGYKGQKIICDFTPSYCTLDADGFAQMKSVGPAKFIFIMRDPVKRLWSQIRMSISASSPRLTDAQYDAACLERAREMCADRDLSTILRADYMRTIEALEAAIPADSIHYVFYENLFTQAAVDGVCKFLGIDPLKVEGKTRVNLGRTSVLPEDMAQQMAQGLAPQYAAVRARFGKDVPDSWRKLADAPRAKGAEKSKILTGIKAKIPFLNNVPGARRIANDGPVIVFPHIPKTAGQTVVKELRRLMPANKFSPIRTHSMAPQDAQMPEGYKLYAGHIDWIDLETLPENRFAFTILRDPRERIASFYFYLLREAAKLSPKELASKERTNMRMISTMTPDEYFFGGDQAWQRFIKDHYNNFYCNYLITRKIRGWRDVANLDHQSLVDRAVTGAGALQKVYSLSNLQQLETDIHEVLGAAINIQGNYVNAGPDATTANRWSDLTKLFEKSSSTGRLETFAQADLDLMMRLNLHL
ncbi:sulfotransferase [Sulfitobacter guttiformis]|uniref:Acetyl esterase/lipase n=1 Tax=Sulfitobacter guttiformis TaxID=74349 RepID=J7FWJ8_9RHOB|nr:alpha/beta hydrolase fold domain-containing protein [Sulfitobacter guttiformis]AFP55483.1 sulfotransferase family protein [Sulfitobacter guttiformis]KIN75502.1 Sulfotransferase family protein [Sulfitobacter guttiformis KCTC 32187]RKE92105.1 acetyl esterase/lipase [Sulfitobacter guttiformis]